MLPPFDETYALSSEQLTFHSENGHIYLPSVVSPEKSATCRPIITDAADRFDTEMDFVEERGTYDNAFLQTMDLRTRDEGVDR